MTALFVSILVASLLGSLHCAGMCGAFLALCVGTGERSGRAHAAHMMYHVGRLTSYVALGAVAGALGAGLDLSGGIVGVQRMALMVAGGGVVVFGLVTFVRLAGVRLPNVLAPAPLRRLAKAAHTLAMRLPPIRMCFVIGLSSTLLPCGWLYAFALVAAGTGSALLGAAAMAVFWLGTVPVMAALGVGVQRLAGPLRRHLPMATAALLIIVGLLTMTGRLRVPALNTDAIGAEPTSATSAAAQVELIDASSLPCCHDPS